MHDDHDNSPSNADADPSRREFLKGTMAAGAAVAGAVGVNMLGARQVAAQ